MSGLEANGYTLKKESNMATSIAASLDKIRASREQARARRLYKSKARTFRRREYQESGVQWLVEKKRGILAHAPGLGKTYVSLEAAETPILVSCPGTLTDQWKAFIEDQYPMWSVTDCSKGTFMQRDALLKTTSDVLIINHDMWARYFMPKVTTVIADEVHHFRNKDAERSKNFATYVNAHKIERVYGLTATPVYKDVGDLWHQLHILYPVIFDSEYNFLSTYANTTQKGWGASVISTRNEKALKNMLKDYMQELTYKQAGMFLPDRIDKDIVLKLDPAFRRDVYDKLRLHYRLQLEGMPEAQRFENAGAVLHMLRRILIDDAKLETIKQIIDDIPKERSVAVFCWYKDSAERIADALGDSIVIDGSLKPDVRRHIALYGYKPDQTTADTKRIRVVTMASMTEGVDLSFMRDVIFAEQDYIPGKNYQAMTRVQRARTEEGYDLDPVVAYWPRYMATVDEIVHTVSRSRSSGNALSVLKEALGID